MQYFSLKHIPSVKLNGTGVTRDKRENWNPCRTFTVELGIQLEAIDMTHEEIHQSIYCIKHIQFIHSIILSFYWQLFRRTGTIYRDVACFWHLSSICSLSLLLSLSLSLSCTRARVFAPFWHNVCDPLRHGHRHIGAKSTTPFLKFAPYWFDINEKLRETFSTVVCVYVCTRVCNILAIPTLAALTHRVPLKTKTENVSNFISFYSSESFHLYKLLRIRIASHLICQNIHRKQAVHVKSQYRQLLYIC